jgi:hypothetical protein
MLSSARPSIDVEVTITMNRIVRLLAKGLCSATLIGGISAVPAVAHAQVTNVAPPAYPAREQAARPYGGYGYVAPETRHERNHGKDGRDWDHRRDWDDRAEWERDRRPDPWARAWQLHAQRCERAYEQGAPPWVLEQMGCREY